MLFHTRHFPIIHWRHSVTQYNFTATLEHEQNFCTHCESLSLLFLLIPFMAIRDCISFRWAIHCVEWFYGVVLSLPPLKLIHISDTTQNTLILHHVTEMLMLVTLEMCDKRGPNVNTILQYVRDGAKIYANNNWTIYLKLAHIKRMCDCVYISTVYQPGTIDTNSLRTNPTDLTGQRRLSGWMALNVYYCISIIVSKYSE